MILIRGLILQPGEELSLLPALAARKPYPGDADRILRTEETLSGCEKERSDSLCLQCCRFRRL